MFNPSSIPNINIDIGKIDNCEITKEDNLYTLLVDGERWMAEDLTTFESSLSQYSSYELAYGKVLCSGFGFGILALWLSQKDNVESITVIEKNQGVIDLFLRNNILPDNVNIILSDMDEYQTQDHYDCILLDHYEYDTTDEKINSARKVAQNIPNHNLFYFWSIEEVYFEKMLSSSIRNLILNKNRWNEFKIFMGIETIAKLTERQVKDFTCLYNTGKSFKTIKEDFMKNHYSYTQNFGI